MKKVALFGSLGFIGCLLLLAIGLGIDALLAFPVMWIWNAVVPVSWPHFTWLLSFGIVVILSLLVGGGSSRK